MGTLVGFCSSQSKQREREREKRERKGSGFGATVRVLKTFDNDFLVLRGKKEI